MKAKPMLYTLTVLGIAGTGLATIIAAMYWQPDSTSASLQESQHAPGQARLFSAMQTTPDSRPLDEGQSNTARMENKDTNRDNSKNAPWQNHPAFVDYVKRLQAGTAINALFEQVHQLDEGDQSQLKQSLFGKVDNFLEQDMISMPEALFLKAAYLKKTLSGADLEAQTRLLRQAYEEERQAALQRYEQSDPVFLSYKTQERNLLKEVMAMDTFPDGLTREQYLRKKLEQVRTALYARADAEDSAQPDG